MMKHLFARVPAAAAALALSVCGAAAQPGCGDIRGAVQEAASAAAIDAETTLAFYETRGGGCSWDDESAAALSAVLETAADHGLDPALFHADLLDPIGANVAVRDVLLTDGAIRFALAMMRGFSAPPTARVDRAVGSRKNGEIIDALIQALDSGNVSAWLDGLAPRTDSYLQLRAARSPHRSIAEAGGWEQMPAALAAKKGRAAQIPALRQRLALEGDLASDNGSAEFDDELHAAVERFQYRNGMRADGKVDAK